MGIAKNSKVWHTALLKIMTKHLIDLYSSLYPRLHELQDSRFFEIFGSDHSSIEMGMYSRSAKELNEKGLLNLDTVFGANADADAVRSLLLEREVSIGAISFLMEEMEGASTLSLIMDRMRRFQAGQRLPYIASLLPKDVTSLDSLSAELKCMIDAISSTLKKPIERVFQSLLKYQAAQLLKTLLHQLARRYNNVEGEEDGLALEDGRDAAASLQDDVDFNTYCRITNLDPANAMQKVKDTAMSYNDTFWRNFEELKIYLREFPQDVMTVEGIQILTVDCSRVDRNNQRYHNVYQWFYSMNGYHRSIGAESKYGLYAHLRPGSIEYNALSGLGASFDSRLNRTAINQRTVERMAISDTDGSMRRCMGFLDM